jgi:phospholipase C
MGQDRIKHVVVLMLENRSFDHMLGYLDQGCLPPLSTSDGVPSNPSDEQSEFVPVRWLDSYADVHVDPGHGYCDVMRQLTGEDRCNMKKGWSKPYNPTNDGFVWNYATRKGLDDQSPEDPTEIMGCYKRERLPVLSTLAAQFAVCSRWHCSLPSETWPNRLFAHAGTSFGTLGFDKPVRWQRSIFDLLDDAELKSRVYAGDVAQVLTFGWDIVRRRRRMRHMNDFEADMQEGDRFPAYTFIEPRHFDSQLFGKSNSQHPIGKMLHLVSSGYVPFGEALIARVYTMLRSNPKIWNHTLLIVTYDEHGGFYDRLPPPEVPATGDVAENGFRFDLLGPRVPALVISPYVRPGVVEHEKTFDHTSITKTVRELFGIPTALSAREDSARTVTSLLDLADPRGDDELPSIGEYTRDDWNPDFEEIEDRPLDDFQRQLLELAGTIDPEIGAELAITDETTSQSVEDQVARFVEKHYPPARP